MSLTAFLNGQRVSAMALGRLEWEALRGSKPQIELPDCRCAGFMRISKLGTQHFVHAKGATNCTSAAESDEHDYFKHQIADAISKAGWSPQIEANDPGGCWRADVMAVRAAVRVAFEVQLSTITFAELSRRHERYRSTGIHAIWFYGPSAFGVQCPPESDIPLFPLGKQNYNFWQPSSAQAPDDVRIGDRQLGLTEAVISLLSGHFRLCSVRRQTTVQSIAIFEFAYCWACQRGFHIYSLMECGGSCGNEPSASEDSGNPLSLNKAGAPWIVQRVREFAAKNPQLNLEVSYPEWLYAESSRRRHFTFPCFHCGALIASEIYEQLLFSGECMQDPNYAIRQVARITLNRREALIDSKHWCYSTSRRFCGPAINRTQ